MTARRIAALTLIAGLGFTARATADVPPVAEPDVCYGCHVEYESLAAQKYVHTAYAAGKCSACHNPHAARHASLLNSDASELCLPCHAAVAQELQGASAHVPAATGDCLACHAPHASEFPNQLHATGADLCRTCHASVASWQSRANVHAPAANDECAACHAPHGSDHDALLANGMPDLCFTCHDQDAAFKRAHKGYQLDAANCATCHDPHASDKAGLIMPNQHGPFQGGNCTACHASGDSAFALKADVTTVCTKCHGSVRTAAAKPYAAHIGGDQSCLNCHNAHASSESALMASETANVCLRCHAKDADWAGKPRESLLTHDGLDCANCHTPHGSDNARYLRSTGEDLCTGCHESAHSAAHPIGPEIIDPRTNESVSCLSCHQLHAPQYEPYLPLSPEMDLCIQCHRR